MELYYEKTWQDEDCPKLFDIATRGHKTCCAEMGRLVQEQKVREDVNGRFWVEPIKKSIDLGFLTEDGVVTPNVTISTACDRRFWITHCPSCQAEIKAVEV